MTAKVFREFPDIRDVFIDLPTGLDAGTDVPNSADSFTIPIQVAGLFTADAFNPPYRRWLMRFKYHWDEGIAMMPVAAPPSGTGGQNGIGVLPTPGGQSARQSAQIVRLSAPYGIMVVYWNAIREVYQPTVPIPAPPNSNAVFAFAEFEGGPPDISENSAKIWEMSGRYMFYLYKPIWLLDGLNVGKTPLHTLQISDNTVPQGKFQQMF